MGGLFSSYRGQPQQKVQAIHWTTKSLQGAKETVISFIAKGTEISCRICLPITSDVTILRSQNTDKGADC
jgi:hypothetical protein